MQPSNKSNTVGQKEKPQVGQKEKLNNEETKDRIPERSKFLCFSTLNILLIAMVMWNYIPVAATILWKLYIF